VHIEHARNPADEVPAFRLRIAQLDDLHLPAAVEDVDHGVAPGVEPDVVLDQEPTRGGDGEVAVGDVDS